MSNRWYILIGWVALLPRLAAAQPAATPTVPSASNPAGPTASVASTVPAGDEPHLSCKAHTGSVVVTFKADTEVKDLVTWAMSFTCKNFVLDPRIAATGKKVTILAPTKLTAREAYQMFLLALSTIGLTVVPRGNAMRVVESGAAKKEALPIGKQILGDGDEVVRVVIRPSHAQPEALRQAFTSLKSDAGDIVVVGSMLVVTDYASTLASMMSLKKLVDVPGGTDGIYTLPVRHGDATKVAQMLTTMFAGPPGVPSMPNVPGRAGGDPPTASELAPSKILVDERTNTLVISASEPAYQRVKALVERVDIAVDLEGGGSIHAYQLSHAIAEEVAQTLTRAIAGEGAAPRTPNAPGRGQAPVPPQPAASPSSSLEGLGATLHGAVRINADKATNKLLITASARDFVALKDIIRELDQPRRQVYIEAMILEVAANSGLAFGASSHLGGPVGSGVGVGGVQLPDLSSLQAATSAEDGGLTGLLGGGLVGGLFGGTSRLFGVTIPSYGVLFKALATQSTTNILSTPSIIALDNEEAKSKIGEDIPYIRGTVPAFPGSSSNVVTTNIDRKPLELELNIKPHISANDTVLLEIKHSAASKGLDGVLGPTWTTRSVETRVVVRDQETVLIGGLMKDSEVDTEQKVPILGDIPLLGHLFKFKTKTKDKTNLLIMLTPYIIRDHTDLQQIRQRKLRENDEFFRSIQSLDGTRFEPRIDYARKRGMVEEINRAVQAVEADIASREAVLAPAGVSEGRVEPASEPDAP